MDLWEPLIGDDSLFCRKEDTNPHDPNAVAIIKEGNIVGHVPQNICTTFWRFFSLPGISINVKVKGKRMNRGGGHGLEVPVQYEFLGPAKAIEWTKKRITEVEEIVNSKVARC